MAINDVAVHSKFRLNGVSYTKLGLMELAYDLIKEGSPFENSIGNFISDWLDEKSTVEVMTSGSTGKPKNMRIQKSHMVNSAIATGAYFNLKEGNTALLCLPVDYIAGKMMLVRAMVLGLELDYVEPVSSPLNKLLKSYDFAAMVPLQLSASLKEIEKIKTLIVGGAKVSRTLKEKVQDKSTAIYETYGMTETITHVAVRKVRLSSVEAQIDTNFIALPNISFSKDDRDCLVINAPKIAHHPVLTNDVVNLISETKFEWVGRYDTIINSGGVKLFPEQIEEKLASLFKKRFFVAGIPDEHLGEKLILVVEGEYDTAKLMQTLSTYDHLERFEIPKNVYTLPKFIETATGKIRRKANCALLNY